MTGRNTRRVSRGGASLPKRDTPVKRALRGRERLRRLLRGKVHEVLPEEPDVEETHVGPVKTLRPKRSDIWPVPCKSALPLSSNAFSESPRDTAVLSATPANKKSSCRPPSAGPPAIRMTSDPEAFKNHGEVVFKGRERNIPPQEKLSLALTSESAMFSSMDSDTTFNSEDEDDDKDCFSLASSSSSSISSPEIFRRELSAETGTFPFNAEHLDLHPSIRNSTLLDESLSQSIQTHQPPNLSAIIDASTILAEKYEISGPEAKTRVKPDSFRSDKEIKWETPAKLTRKRHILCKKKVIFKSPIISEVFEIKHPLAAKRTVPHTIDPAQTSGPDEHKKPGEETSRAGDMTTKDDTLLLRVTLQRPVTSSPEKAKFFDFVSDDSEDVFFQMMRERAVKLRGAPLFPLTANKHTLTW